MRRRDGAIAERVNRRRVTIWALRAALALAAALYLFRSYARGTGLWTSPATRHLRALKERQRPPDTLAAISFRDLATLPRGLAWTATDPIEQRGVILEGWVQRMHRAFDGDLGIEISETNARRSNFINVEVTPRWR